MDDPSRVIASHAKQARYYKYRIPYAQSLFDELAKALELGKHSHLLDICCGSGQLSAGLAGCVERIHAIDGSQEMLSLAPALKNVVYVQGDVNASVLPDAISEHVYDHFLIGRAIPYLHRERLKKIVSANLKSGGSIVICAAGWAKSTVWLSALERLQQPYCTDQMLEFDGERKLEDLGFKLADRIVIREKATCHPLYLLNYSLAYAERGQKIAAELPQFRERLIQGMQPFTVDGKLHGETVSWALIYRPTGDGAA